VGRDRFDDVEYRVLEEPEPPRRPRLRRWTLTALSAVLAAGAFASGASALSADEPVSKAKSASKNGKTVYPHDWRDCDRVPSAALRH
jgi:hypothetical protein